MVDQLRCASELANLRPNGDPFRLHLLPFPGFAVRVALSVRRVLKNARDGLEPRKLWRSGPEVDSSPVAGSAIGAEGADAGAFPRDQVPAAAEPSERQCRVADRNDNVVASARGGTSG